MRYEEQLRTRFVMSSETAFFDIIAEAKMTALVIMCKKYHPDWSIEEVENRLKGLLEYVIEKGRKE